MTDNEIMEHISEALHNLRDDYPIESKALAHQAFGHLMARFNWHPHIMTSLKENGAVRQELVYRDKGNRINKLFKVNE